jgi:hypothetical protein
MIERRGKVERAVAGVGAGFALAGGALPPVITEAVADGGVADTATTALREVVSLVRR